VEAATESNHFTGTALREPKQYRQQFNFAPRVGFLLVTDVWQQKDSGPAD
jgi:hypothetical protein